MHNKFSICLNSIHLRWYGWNIWRTVVQDILDVPKKRKTNREGQWPMNVKYGSNPDMKFTNPNALSLSNSEMFRDQGSKAKGYEWIISQRRVLNPGNNCNRLGHWPHGLSLLPGTMREQSCEKDDPGSQPSISKKTFVISCYISSMDIINQKSLKKVLAPMKHQWNSHHCVQFRCLKFFLGTLRHHPVTRSSSTPVSSLTNLTFQKRLQWQ